MKLNELCLSCTNDDVLILNRYGDEIAIWRHKDRDILRYDGREEPVWYSDIIEIYASIVYEHGAPKPIVTARIA